MKKNSFMIYNDLIYELYGCRSMGEVMRVMRTHLRMLISFSYASLLISDGRDERGNVRYREPLCIPEAFSEAEEKYMLHIDEDPQAWLMYGSETTLIRESDLMEGENRLTTPLYQHCYSGYDIYDTMQASLIFRGEFLGILTLFHTKKEGIFNEEDAFFCRAMCTHLDRIVYGILRSPSAAPAAPVLTPERVRKLSETYRLTARETQVLLLLFDLKDNREIATELNIQESTLQKHLQNLYRKTGTASRLELMKLDQRERF
ncbi:MAG: helix-turn-helix transcriptional regulator [Lachnospiraceae bacterium]|nr:helix-turn-helix transcriptional regulator [Lachnospiraceae bacterium]